MRTTEELRRGGEGGEDRGREAHKQFLPKFHTCTYIQHTESIEIL